MTRTDWCAALRQAVAASAGGTLFVLWAAGVSAADPIRSLPPTEIAVPLNARSGSDDPAEELSFIDSTADSSAHTNILAAPVDPAEIDSPEDGQPESRAMSWDEYFQQRTESVTGACPGPHCDDSLSLLDWWHEQSMIYRARNQRLARPLVEEVINPAITTITDDEKRQQFIARHTLPEEPEFAVDVYDENPRVVALESGEGASMVPQENPASAISRLNRDISEIQPTLSYAMRGISEKDLPEDFYNQTDSGEYVPTSHGPLVLQWAPTNLAWNPLYFEDPALERYGHTYHPLIQPFASTGRFATQLVGLPYQMTLHPIHSREYSLGRFRPGDCAPKLRYQVPFNEEAALMQAAAIAGLILIFP